MILTLILTLIHALSYPYPFSSPDLNPNPTLTLTFKPKPNPNSVGLANPFFFFFEFGLQNGKLHLGLKNLGTTEKSPPPQSATCSNQDCKLHKIGNIPFQLRGWRNAKTVGKHFSILNKAYSHSHIIQGAQFFSHWKALGSLTWCYNESNHIMLTVLFQWKC